VCVDGAGAAEEKHARALLKENQKIKYKRRAFDNYCKRVRPKSRCAGAGAAAGGATGSVDGATAGAIARASTGTAPGMVTNIAVGLKAGSSVARRDRGSWCSAPSWTSGLAHRAAGLPNSG
jgi:hypothetical protein